MDDGANAENAVAQFNGFTIPKCPSLQLNCGVKLGVVITKDNEKNIDAIVQKRMKTVVTSTSGKWREVFSFAFECNTSNYC